MKLRGCLLSAETMSRLSKLSRAWLKRNACLSVIALLFAQLSVAAYACSTPDHFTILLGGTVAQCMDHTKPDSHTQAVCHEHCKAEVPLGEMAWTQPPEVSVAVFITLPPSPDRLLFSVRAADLNVRLVAPPPHILFCTYRS